MITPFILNPWHPYNKALLKFNLACFINKIQIQIKMENMEIDR